MDLYFKVNYLNSKTPQKKSPERLLAALLRLFSEAFRGASYLPYCKYFTSPLQKMFSWSILLANCEMAWFALLMAFVCPVMVFILPFSNPASPLLPLSSPPKFSHHSGQPQHWLQHHQHWDLLPGQGQCWYWGAAGPRGWQQWKPCVQSPPPPSPHHPP